MSGKKKCEPKRRKKSATLYFELPDDKPDFLCSYHGSEAFSVLWEIDQMLRTIVRYREERLPQIPEDLLEKISEIRAIISKAHAKAEYC